MLLPIGTVASGDVTSCIPTGQVTSALDTRLPCRYREIPQGSAALTLLEQFASGSHDSGSLPAVCVAHSCLLPASLEVATSHPGEQSTGGPQRRIHPHPQSKLEDLGGRIQLHFLPPYFPRENRIELIRLQLHRNVTCNHRCSNIQELMQMTDAYLIGRSTGLGPLPDGEFLIAIGSAERREWGGIHPYCITSPSAGSRLS